jgi:hypothetical protein
MTAQQDPEYQITESKLHRLEQLGANEDGDTESYDIGKDTRSRGSVQPEQRIICPHICERVCIENVAEHDAAIAEKAREEGAKQERERILNRAIEKFGEWYDAGFARPVTKEHVTKILESLRSEVRK